MLRVIRSAQWLQECGPARASCTGDRFKRPLGCAAYFLFPCFRGETMRFRSFWSTLSP